MALRWYLGTSGAYGSDGNFGDPQIADRPSPDHIYESGAWRLKTQTETDAETDARLDVEFDVDKKLKMLVIWMANLNGLTNQQAKDQLRAIYKTLP